MAYSLQIKARLLSKSSLVCRSINIETGRRLRLHQSCSAKDGRVIVRQLGNTNFQLPFKMKQRCSSKDLRTGSSNTSPAFTGPQNKKTASGPLKVTGDSVLSESPIPDTPVMLPYRWDFAGRRGMRPIEASTHLV